MAKTLFQKKINYLFNKLQFKDREKEFVAWFSKEIHDYSVRRKTVIKKWKDGEMKDSPKGGFDKYPISKENINGILAFPKHCFLDTEGLKNFENRVDNYQLNRVYTASEKLGFDYKYLYYFNKELNKILSLKLNVIETDKNQSIIELLPSSIYKDKGLDIYRGTLIEDKNHYYISAKNSFERITFYFLCNQTFNKNEWLYGLSLELSHHTLLPTAKQRVLTKNKLSIDEQKELYLTLNETEYLVAHTKNEQSLFNKLQTKLDTLNSFISHSKELFKDDVYFHIFYDTFCSFYEISNHIKLDQRYWISNKRRAYKIFLESMKHQEATRCYIVTPIYDSYIYLFDKHSKSLVECNIQSAQNGLTIEHIFVVTKEYELTHFIQKTVQKLEAHGINIRFILLDALKQISIDSYDFLCTNNKDVALYRDVDEHKYFYNVSKSNKKLERLLANYEEIKKLSYSMNDCLIQQQHKDDDVLKALVGKWYHYYYGSRKYKNRYKIWKSELIIQKDGTLQYIDKGVVTLQGEINTTFNQEHPFIYATAIESGSLSLTQLDRVDIYRGIFKAPILDKKLSSSLNMASIGFLSKQTLQENDIRKILGNDEHGIILEDDKMQDRIIDYYNELLDF